MKRDSDILHAEGVSGDPETLYAVIEKEQKKDNKE